ncbi:hypothetical protein COV18_01210 [Candidatus Woesearchaeota archaeon CG10_big_fil_rev_8_21_14_0_10_37_12]|nr:MAG: hypothetical protein COV18_01210 [Candidatus Woesearchaeota archaeon CG10_big_fil_rev_8_21_14_0_10_37_12]
MVDEKLRRDILDQAANVTTQIWSRTVTDFMTVPKLLHADATGKAETMGKKPPWSNCNIQRNAFTFDPTAKTITIIIKADCAGAGYSDTFKIRIELTEKAGQVNKLPVSGNWFFETTGTSVQGSQNSGNIEEIIYASGLSDNKLATTTKKLFDNTIKPLLTKAMSDRAGYRLFGVQRALQLSA